MVTVPEWLESQAERMMQRQRAEVDTAKLVVTFSSSVAATLVGTALQVKPTGACDIAVSCLLAISVLFALLTIAADKFHEPDHDAVMSVAAFAQWSEDQKVNMLRASMDKAVRQNVHVIATVVRLAVVQLIFAVATGALSALSLLR